MNLTPESYAEICKQSAFISALVAGLIICSLAWTLTASRMTLYIEGDIAQVPQTFLNLHKILSLIFVSSFFFFLVTLGLSGWIRSKTLGIVSSTISLIATICDLIKVQHLTRTIKFKGSSRFSQVKIQRNIFQINCIVVQEVITFT